LWDREVHDFKQFSAVMLQRGATIMKTNRINFALGLLVSCSVSTRADNYSAGELARRTMERRTIEAIVWGMPAVNYDLMLQEMLTKTSGKVNQVIYWGRPPRLA
jgi:hypothetical protein